MLPNLDIDSIVNEKTVKAVEKQVEQFYSSITKNPDSFKESGFFI